MKFLPERPDALDSFAPETDLTAPLFAGHSPNAHLASEIPFIIHEEPVPPAPVRAARGRVRRALTVLALLAAAGWAAYEYGFRRPLDLDTIAAWASGLVSPTIPARPPMEPLPLDPPPSNSQQVASSGTAVSRTADRTAVARSTTPVATASEGVRPAAARQENIGTSGSLVSPVQNVSGAWRLNTQTETSDSFLEGLTLHYDVTLAQDGDRVTGVGTKVSEGEGDRPGARTPVTISGIIAGERLTLNVVERSSESETRGKIVLVVDNSGALRGRFSSSTVPTSGHVEGHRVTSAP